MKTHQKVKKWPIFNSKPLVLNKNTTDFQDINTSGVPFGLDTYYDDVSTRTEPPFLPIHNPSYLTAATSPLPQLADYISHTKSGSAFENSAVYTVWEPTTPIVITYKPPILTANMSTTENASKKAEFDQKPPKPPEIIHIPNIWHLTIIANSIPTSGKDPPHLTKSFLSCFHTTYKILTHFWEFRHISSFPSSIFFFILLF